MSKLSAFLADQLARNYFSLTKLFRKSENKTIELYTIEGKIERVKQLLREGELTLSEISYRLGYSNVQHLSNQFKKIVGSSVSQFKENLSLSAQSAVRLHQLIIEKEGSIAQRSVDLKRLNFGASHTETTAPCLHLSKVG